MKNRNKNIFRFKVLIVLLIFVGGCTPSKSNQQSTNNSDNSVTEDETAKTVSTPKTPNTPSDFLPEGFKIFQEIYGDLNADGSKDCILIIKGTDKKNIVTDESLGELNYNRRGIIILFNKEEQYELALKNYSCLSSEMDEEDRYLASPNTPYLGVSIAKGNLYFHYDNGKYGDWKYTFKYRNSDFELIGYDMSNRDWHIVQDEISINFLSKKKLKRVNVNYEKRHEEGFEEAVFKETWENIKIEKPIKLSEIKDIDDIGPF